MKSLKRNLKTNNNWRKKKSNFMKKNQKLHKRSLI